MSKRGTGSTVQTFHQQSKPAINAGSSESMGWLSAAAQNEWQKFDRLSGKKKDESSYLVGKGFRVFVQEEKGFGILLKK